MSLITRMTDILTGYVYPGIPAFKRKTVTKTSAYTILRTETGSVFNNRGAGGAVAFTLPALEADLIFWFMGCVLAQDMSVVSPEGNNIVAFNDIAATSVAYSTANMRAGQGGCMVCDGTLWMFFANLGAAEQSTIDNPTIA